jgi:predicted DNA-binding protein
MNLQHVTTSVRLTKELHSRVIEAAKRDNRTLSNVIQTQLERYIESRKLKNEKEVGPNVQ